MQDIPLWQGISFLKDQHAYIERARCKYGNIFTIHVFGQRFHVVCDEVAGKNVWSSSRAFSFRPFGIRAGKLVFGVNGDIHGKPGLHSEFYKTFAKYYTGAALKPLNETFQKSLASEISKLLPVEKTLPLYKFIRESIQYATADAVMGPGFSNDQIFDDAWTVDNAFSALMMELPTSKAKSGKEARERLLIPVRSWLENNKGNESIQSLYEVMLKHSQKPDTTDSLGSIFWASMVNTIPASYQVYIQILTNNLVEKVRNELKNAFVEGTNIDIIQKAPFLDACVTETLRLTSSAMSIRIALDDAKIVDSSGQSFHIRKGDNIFIAPGEWHRDIARFVEPQKFDPTRWLDATDLEKAIVRPFGGGESLCPGRHFATSELKLFVANMVMKYDAQIVGKVYPSAAHPHNAIPIPTQDVDVRFVPRR